MERLRSSVRPIVTYLIVSVLCALAVFFYWHNRTVPDWFVDLGKLVVTFWFVERALRHVEPPR